MPTSYRAASNQSVKIAHCSLVYVYHPFRPEDRKNSSTLLVAAIAVHLHPLVSTIQGLHEKVPLHSTYHPKQ